jgi:hypothetical protein
MTDYYPDTYAKFMSALGIGIDYDDADFDRYHAEFLADLAERDRQVAERAWDSCVEHLEAILGGDMKRAAHADSPYRAAKGEQSNGEA